MTAASLFHVEHSYSKILENDSIKRSMALSIACGRVSHAYIIAGGAGFGKTMLAHAFAKAILCFAPNEGQPCDACSSCRTYDTGNNPDLVTVRPQKASFGVDDVRDGIIADLAVLPYANAKRVYILAKAHTMTPSAQNALLKSLEDGPKHAVFILLSNNLEAFLPTILSRAISYKIAPLAQAVIEKFLLDNGIVKETAQIAAWFSGGGIGQALRLATDEDFMQLREMTLDIAKRIEQMSIPEIFAMAKSLEAHKDSIHDILHILKLHYRDELIKGKAKYLNNITAIGDTTEKLSRNCPFLLCMEMLLLQLNDID